MRSNAFSANDCKPAESSEVLAEDVIERQSKPRLGFDPWDDPASR
jgi:hypothetical protein